VNGGRRVRELDAWPARAFLRSRACAFGIPSAASSPTAEGRPAATDRLSLAHRLQRSRQNVSSAVPAFATSKILKLPGRHREHPASPSDKAPAPPVGSSPTRNRNRVCADQLEGARKVPLRHADLGILRSARVWNGCFVRMERNPCAPERGPVMRHGAKAVEPLAPIRPVHHGVRE